MQFKKTLIATSALMSAAVWAPQAHAIPAFARQVGMACSACHYQHFPALNSFGRAFKEAGYTMVGSQEKIEADGLSIPAVLNAALVGYMQYQKTNGPTVAGTITGVGAAATATTKTSNNGQFQVPQQVSLFLGGRVGEHIGFEGEINMSGAGTVAAAGTGTGLIRLKVPFVFDLGGVTAEVIPFSTQALGVADSFEVLNTGAVAVHAFNQTAPVASASPTGLGGITTISAQQYIGTASPASGVAFTASNDQFFANFSKWGVNQGAGNSGSPTSNYLRAAWTPSNLIDGFDTAVGFQIWSGTSTLVAAPAAPTAYGVAVGLPAAFAVGPVSTKASAIDFQMLGDVSGMPLTLVASYARAPATSYAAGAVAGQLNQFNMGPQTKKSFNIGAELGVIPNKATLQFGIRRASSGIPVLTGVTAGAPVVTAGSNASDNAIMFGATYNIALNMRAELTYVKASGDMYNSIVSTGMGSAYAGDTLTVLDLAFGF